VWRVAGRTVADERIVGRQEIWQERPAGGLVDASLLTRPWRELLRLIDDGGAPRPPVAHLCGRRLIALEEGRAALAIPASEWFCGPKGRVDSGVFAFLADMTHFYAVLSTLPARAGCTTAELSMTFLGQPPYAGGELTASSEVVYADDRNALAVALVCDHQGQPVAHSTSHIQPRRASILAACLPASGLDVARLVVRAASTDMRSLLVSTTSGIRVDAAEGIAFIEKQRPPRRFRSDLDQ
jgi:uncharacterized protein (TIGR00369 family)